MVRIQHGGKEVTARLVRFDKKYIIEGVKRYNEIKPERFKPDSADNYKDIKLCNYRDKWWIYYGPNHMTGHFDSKQKAIQWFTKAGR
jgi:hypothetical protein